MTPRFETAFESLTGYTPMRWQHRLFERFVANDVPEVCDLPTGLGKTSVLVLWLLALVRQGETGSVRLPRRLAYIVNRRTVVDQATDIVTAIRDRLANPTAPEWAGHADTLRHIASTLHSLAASAGPPLAISTLRGELADNEEWKADPARPAIVVGTIDMIGSKLLFNGYGDGRYGRAHHAGLLGQDTLIVHDEAHLTPAFSDLLRAIVREQAREQSRNGGASLAARPVRVLELSATSRSAGAHTFALDPSDEADEIVRQRLDAAKRLRLHDAPSTAIVDKIIELAAEHEAAGVRVLIYVHGPEDAQRVATGLEKRLGRSAGKRIALLTGTIRGYERDLLVKRNGVDRERNVVYRALQGAGEPVDQTVYLVSTAAGEVGVDLCADHLICDATSLEALIQRLGRVNRRGTLEGVARVDVVGEASRDNLPPPVAAAVEATVALLRRWADAADREIDVSPRNVRRLLATATPQEVQAAFSPTPRTLPITDILLDAWSLTSVEEMPGRPEVAPFLHGLTYEAPETWVAWRREVKLFDDHDVDDDSIGGWFRICRIEARERLRDREDRVKKALERLLHVHRKRGSEHDLPVVLLDVHGRARRTTLSAIVTKDAALAGRTVVLPIEAGGLDASGMLDPEAAPGDATELDVCERATDGARRERWLFHGSAEDGPYERLMGGEIADAIPRGQRVKVRIPLSTAEAGDDAEEGSELLLTMSPDASALENPETTAARQSLAAHTEAIVAQIAAIAERVALPDPLRAALTAAARLHDCGKARPIWQWYAQNERGAEPIAKSPRYLHPRVLGGYRHELGSLLDAAAGDDLTPTERALGLHLVAAHHGWARPHFEPRAYDSTYSPQRNLETVWEQMRRFDALQREYGRWGLAWLESLLRCADIAASRLAAEASSNDPARDPQR
ncbi:MAG: type I-U CRISPR-associated helicase/endonuclease Cas3 [Gemmatimonadaceae bacterium]|nr:type I-U CRISPR-associated helicase/endonuclease Cas3 [Gemmatimonadaceae bacterium]